MLKRRRFNPKAIVVGNKNKVHKSNFCIQKSLKHLSNIKNQELKVLAKLLYKLALSILTELDSQLNIHSTNSKDGISLITKITDNWIQHFMYSQNTLILLQRGRLMCSLSNELHIEMQIAFDIRVLNRGFLSGKFQEYVKF